MKKQKTWVELSPVARGRIVVAGVIQVALLVAALWDIVRRPAKEIRGRKITWIGISLINFIGPIAYFLFGRYPKEQEPEDAILPKDMPPFPEYEATGLVM